MDELGSDERDRFVEKRQQEGASGAMINRELSYLNRMFSIGRQAVPPNVMNPFKFKRLAEAQPHQGFITDAQLLKFIEACHVSTNSLRDQWHYAALAILGYHLGWRSKELRSLKVSQVEVETKSVRLYRDQSKNKQGRLFKLPVACWRIIKTYMSGKKSEDYLITRSNGFPIKRIKDAWRDISSRAGLPGFMFHDLRRTAARNMLRAGVSPYTVLAMVGWKTHSMLQRYDIVHESDLADAVERLNGTGKLVHKFMHTGEFKALESIQSWKPKYCGKKKLAA